MVGGRSLCTILSGRQGVGDAARSLSLRPKEEGLREEPVPPVRSRAARTAVPQWRFRRNARDRKGELENPKGLTEGL